METQGYLSRHPRRKFLAGFLTTIVGAAAAFFVPKRGRAVENPTPEAGPILYSRTEEAERYYRTLHR